MFFQVAFQYLHLRALDLLCSQQARPVRWDRRFVCPAFDILHKDQEYVLPVGNAHTNRYPIPALLCSLNHLWSTYFQELRPS